MMRIQRIQRIRRWIVVSAIAATLASSAWAPRSHAEPATRPTEAIEALHALLLDVMRDAERLGYEGRAAKLGAAIPQFYDVEFMAQISAGRHWRSAPADERARYVAAFRDYMVAKYAGRFDGYSGQSFETLGQEPARRDTVVVKSRLVNPAGEDVDLNYRMRRVGDVGWKIIDVYLDGMVSELALRRSEFSGIVERESFAALITALGAQVEKLAAGAES